MSNPDTAIDKVGVELHELATEYAVRAEALASDPYFRDAVVKVSAPNFVWAFYDLFVAPMDRDALNAELRFQADAVGRAVGSSSETTQRIAS